jgi:hypothetical protein
MIVNKYFLAGLISTAVFTFLYSKNKPYEYSKYKIHILSIYGIVMAYISLSYLNRSKENFTALNSITSELTTYDDYGTFNNILQTDDLPYYDPTYMNMMCKFQRKVPNDEYIPYDNDIMKRNMIPANYSNDLQIANANMQNDMLINKNQKKNSSVPPVAHNYY